MNPKTIKILQFFRSYGIDWETEDTTVNINSFIIPNYYNMTLGHLNKQVENFANFEFCHQVYKIFGTVLQSGLCCYETDQTQINSNDIVFDLGGNYGLFAAYAAQKANKVYSFEPMSFIRIYLRNTQKLFCDKIVIVPYACSNQNIITLFTQCDNPAASHDSNIIAFTHNRELYTEQVRVVKLDDFISENKIYPTFIKADIEDAEYNMLLGCQEYIKNKHPKLSLVLHTNIPEKITAIQNLLPDYNFSISLKEHCILTGF